MADAKPHFELMALSLLMCTPSDLNQKWTDPNGTPDDVEVELTKLGFSDLALARARDLLENVDKTSARLFFGAVAQTLTQMNPEYAGSKAHPDVSAAKVLVSAMQELDNQPLKKIA